MAGWNLRLWWPTTGQSATFMIDSAGIIASPAQCPASVAKKRIKRKPPEQRPAKIRANNRHGRVVALWAIEFRDGSFFDDFFRPQRRLDGLPAVLRASALVLWVAELLLRT